MIKNNTLYKLKQSKFIIYINKKLTGCYEHDCFMAAGNITYKLIISVIPTAIVITALFSGIPEIEAWLMETIRPILAPQAYSFVQYISLLANKYLSAPVLPISIIMMLYTASSSMYSLLKGISTASEGRLIFEKRGNIKNRFLAVILTLIVISAIFTIWLINLQISKIAMLKNKKALQYIIVAAMLIIVLMCIFKSAPVNKVSAKKALLRAIMSSVMIILLTFAINIYYSQISTPENIYGTFAGVAIIMIWIYGISLCLLISGEI